MTICCSVHDVGDVENVGQWYHPDVGDVGDGDRVTLMLEMVPLGLLFELLNQ